MLLISNFYIIIRKHTVQNINPALFVQTFQCNIWSIFLNIPWVLKKKCKFFQDYFCPFLLVVLFCLYYMLLFDIYKFYIIVAFYHYHYEMALYLQKYLLPVSL